MEAGTREELRKILESLGFDLEDVENRVGYVDVPVEIEVTEETPHLCVDHCNASLVSVSQDYKKYGNVEVAGVRKARAYCGPDSYEVFCYRLRLSPGSLVYYYERGFTGDTWHNYRVIYVNPRR